MGIEQISSAQSFALAGYEVFDDAWKTQRANRLATNLLAQIEKRALGQIDGRHSLVHDRIVKTLDERKRVNATAQGRKGGSFPLQNYVEAFIAVWKQVKTDLHGRIAR
jgi:hypothetical protein